MMRYDMEDIYFYIITIYFSRIIISSCYNDIFVYITEVAVSEKQSLDAGHEVTKEEGDAIFSVSVLEMFVIGK